MTSARRSITTLLVGTAILFLGNGLLITLLPIRATLEGFSTSSIGFMGAAYFAGFAAGCLVGPGAVRRVGHIRCFAGFAALGAVTTLAYPLLLDPVAWIVLRALTGLCLAVLFMVVESWLNVQTDNKARGAVLSIYIIVANLVTVGGQLMVNLAPPREIELFIWVGMMVCLSLVPLSLTAADAPARIGSARLGVAALYRLSPAGFIGCLVVGAVEGAFWTLGPVFAQGRGLPVAQIAIFMSAFVVGGTLSQWPLGTLSDRIDRRAVIAGCSLGTVATGLALAFVELDGIVPAFALACLHGAFMVPIYALCLAHANDYAPNETLVEVSSGLLLTYAAGAVIGPLVVGAAMEIYGPGSLFISMAAMFGALAVFILYRVLRRSASDARWPGQCVPLPKTTPLVYSLESDD